MANQSKGRNGVEPLYSMSFTLFSSSEAALDVKIERATDRELSRLGTFEAALQEARKKPTPDQQVWAALEAAHKLATASEDREVRSAGLLYAYAASAVRKASDTLLQDLGAACRYYAAAKTYDEQIEAMSKALSVVIEFIEKRDGGGQRLTEPLRRLDLGLFNRRQNAPDAIMDKPGGRGRHPLDHEQVARQMRVAAAVEIWIRGRGLNKTPARAKVHATQRKLKWGMSDSWVRDSHQRFGDRVPFATLEIATDEAAETAARECLRNWRKDLPR